MGKTIAVTNQKGGVGKTTTAVNVSAGVGKLGKKSLLVDVDPQGNATSGVGVDKRSIKYSSYNIIIDGVKAQETIIHTAYDNLDVIPASIELAAADMELVDVEKRESRLKNALALVKDQYDYIFIDCPPSLGLITTNALCAADTILVEIHDRHTETWCF